MSSEKERAELLELVGEHRVLGESPVEVGELAEKAGRTFNDPELNKKRLLRWGRDGLLAHDGRRVRLEVVAVGGGGRIVSSMPALVRFLRAVNGDRAVAPPEVQNLGGFTGEPVIAKV